MTATPTPPALTRTFIALDLSDDARAALRRELQRLSHALRAQPGQPGVRLADPAELHLTLAFLGDVDAATLSAIGDLAETLARATAPFQLALARLGVFGPPAAPRVVWMGVGGETTRLLALQRSLADALAELGFPREQRPFSPHLTLARLKAPLADAARQRLDALLAGPPPTPVRWRMADLRVMRSDLSATGARYTPLRIAPLAGRSARSRKRAGEGKADGKREGRGEGRGEGKW